MTTYNLADLFELVVDAVADREAIVAGDRRLTYAQLEEIVRSPAGKTDYRWAKQTAASAAR